MAMSESEVTLTIEGRQVSVPPGTLLVDAAKKAGIYIPVFCYHPKLDPVGMCRMCLVEIGRPKRDRGSGDYIRDQSGQVIIEFGPNLETACTTPVGEGWVVRTASEKALAGQADIVEFLLTSHPLDCPVCDKGGECPLQELTMDFGAGKSRFHYSDKMHLGKHVPLGDLIYLDQERCIQCARCTRFQQELADDPVIGFEERGRKLQIVTYSDPGFDSYFSGNTTDICPVGALTTADFRFEARPWEMKAAASICPHCPVGCNTMINTRRQPNAEGRVTVQRVLPRQNEQVNEIWLCDKGRFAHHYGDSQDRLRTPLVRRDGVLVETTWEEAIERAAEGLAAAADSVVGLAGGRLSNEDYFAFAGALRGTGGRAILADSMPGGDLVAQFAPAPGTNLGDVGAGDAVLVIASDLHEEAPIWWLRLKGAAERGAELVVANARETRLDKYAQHRLRYSYPGAAECALGLLQAISGAAALADYRSQDPEVAAAAKTLAEADNLLVFYGREGQSYAAGEALAQACSRLVSTCGQLGEPNNGLAAVWPHNNTQGAWDMGLRPEPQGAAAALAGAQALWLLAVDPIGDDPQLEGILEQASFVVLQELYRTPTAERADVVLPAQSHLEREGTFTSGERRLQRFYPVLPATGEARPDWKIAVQLAAAMGVKLEGRAPATVFGEIAASIPGYEELTYGDLAQAQAQWPRVGGEDLYFGGTSFTNQQGLGVQLPPLAVREGRRPESEEFDWQGALSERPDGLLLIPIDRLYDRGLTVRASEVLEPRLAGQRLEISPQDAESLGVQNGTLLELRRDGGDLSLEANVRPEVPAGAVLLPRSLGIPLDGPEPVELGAVEG